MAHATSKKARLRAEDKYKRVLGMSIGKATRKLDRMILLHLAKHCGMDNCFVCKKPITSSVELSIEHKKDWLNVGEELYWDLGNIAFSHQKCNRPHNWNGKSKVFFSEYPDGQAWCSECRLLKPVQEFYKNRARWNGLCSFCKDCKKKHI